MCIRDSPTAPTPPASTSAGPSQGSRTLPPRKAKSNAPNYAANPIKPAHKRKPKPKRKRSKGDDAVEVNEGDTESANTDDQRESLIKKAKSIFKPAKKKRDSKSPGNIRAFFKPVPPPTDLLSPISSPKSNPFLTLREDQVPNDRANLDPVQLALQEAGLLDLQTNTDSTVTISIIQTRNKTTNPRPLTISQTYTYPYLLTFHPQISLVPPIPTMSTDATMTDPADSIDPVENLPQVCLLYTSPSPRD